MYNENSRAQLKRNMFKTPMVVIQAKSYRYGKNRAHIQQNQSIHILKWMFLVIMIVMVFYFSR
ncbi:MULTISPECIES: hypothetical protein [unclassified Acinetobacter]|uniref:hypothetical protein n=1 Tax=unclassified Acinetobacter TaxID=196816 RepID=UPI0029352D9E|nr:MULTISPECIES: hypothetical protein [unclassified Acinetobacter]WOE32280.1 hypothetical protein QSG84_03460 [Acinetobacter sp. SAAs470]WOE37751.1 hypothetical protein QSG86_12505 [Acinetobacter sp. SAAs474]